MSLAAPRPPIELHERLYTVEDLAALPRELPSGPVRYELDNGRLISMPPTGVDHGRSELRLGTELLIQGERADHGVAFSGEVGVILWRSPDRVVGVDAAFITRQALPFERSSEGYLLTIPDLVVEVVSKNDTRPYVQRKVDDYLAAGVRVVWVANPISRTITIHRSGGEVQALGPDETLIEEMIPGFSLPVRDAFGS